MNIPLSLLLVVVAVISLLLLLFVSGVIFFPLSLRANILYYFIHFFVSLCVRAIFLCTLVTVLDIFGRAKWKNSSHHCFVYFRYDGKIRWHNNFCRWYFLSSCEFSFAIHARSPNTTLSRYASTNPRSTAFWIYFYIFSYIFCCCYC